MVLPGQPRACGGFLNNSAALSGVLLLQSFFLTERRASAAGCPEYFQRGHEAGFY